MEPQANPALRKKLLWVFGSILVGSTTYLIVGLQTQDESQTSLLAIALALGLWSLSMFLSVKEDPGSGYEKYQFTSVWSARPAFRITNVLLGFLMCASMYVIVRITPEPPNAGPYIIAMFSSMFVFYVIQMLYLNAALKVPVPEERDNWTTGQKQLENVSTALVILLCIAGYPILHAFLPDLIEELYFALLFAGLGFLPGYLAHDFFKNHFTGFFNKDEPQRQILINIYLSGLILTLCTTAVVNHRTAALNTEIRRYRVEEKSETYKRDHYLWLSIDGKRKRFEPKMAAWEQAVPGDTMSVLVGKGCLGFEVILQYGAAQNED